MRETIAIAGALAQKAGQGGLSWVYLQYALGFRRLGFDVLFLDWLSPAMCADAPNETVDPLRSANARYFLAVMRGFGFDHSFALLDPERGRTIGLPRSEIVARLRRSVLLLNVMGYLEDEELLAAPPRRVFLDIDPGFGQMWHELGLHDPYPAHDTFVTVGENVGRQGCEIPTCGREWITTPQPVVFDQWQWTEDGLGLFTSVASWRGPYGPVEYAGRTYGLRVHEFRRFASVPRACGRGFELALDIHPDDSHDRELLEAGGWLLRDPSDVAADPWAYRNYLRASHAEFAVAKHMYVATASGWFSDRSICYLACGKPVLAQDTGLAGRYPCGEGLLTFTTPDEAIAGVDEIQRDYGRHARAAHELAREYFDSDRVLGRLLGELGV
jgi:hypothetical protein